MRLRRLLALAVIAGAAFAAPLPVQNAVSSTVQGMTYEQVLQWSNNQFAKQATFGRYVRWGGAIILGSALVYTALDYFYGSLKQQTGTSLDQWYNWIYISWHDAVMDVRCSQTSNGSNIYYYVYIDHYIYIHGDKLFTWQYTELACPADKVAYAKTKISTPPNYYWLDGASVRLQSGRVVTSKTAAISDNPRPTLPEWIQSHPDAAQGVKTAVGKYIQDTPPGSRSNPYPGVQLDPVPNPNQWTDNPYTDKSVDTDGDGWPDWMEKQVPWPDGINDRDDSSD